MTKTVVDDYYSNIELSEENKKDKALSGKKIKIASKKKVIKKAQKKDVEKKVETTEEKTIKTSSPIKTEEKKVSKFKKVFKKPMEKIEKKEEKKETEKVKEPKREKIKFEEPKIVNANSNFKNKKQKTKSFKSEEEENTNRKKIGFKKSFSRRKISIHDLNNEEKDNNFKRSNKINQKKKEKKDVDSIKQNLTSRQGEEVKVGNILTVKELSEKIGIPFSALIAEFMKNGMMVNINSKIDFESANIVSEILGVKLVRESDSGLNVNEILDGNISSLLVEDNPEKLKERPPIISIMGHVDHGKTSLLDHIRESKIASGEAGGITQSIGAYQVEQNGKKITFLDTPGHEAFTVMRARGAKSTDIAILVVAADEGVKPQTVESINHAKEAGIPIIVAINKMDKEGANPDNVKSGLSENGLIPEDWGGDIPMIPVSAKTGFGVDDLLGVVLLVAEMQELKANPDRNAVATVIESHLDHNLGAVATVIINTGTLEKGDNIVCKDTFGKVKTIKSHNLKGLKKVGPGDPAMIVGLNKVVEGGDIIQKMSTIDNAKQKSLEYLEIMKSQKSSQTTGIDLIMSKIKSGNLKQLKIVVKADTNGSLEAIKSSLLKLSTDETSVSIIHSGVGEINEGDVLMCQGSEAILVGFRSKVLNTAKQVIEESKIEIINSDIIYHITEKIEKIITGMLDPKEIEVDLGKAKVAGIFYTSKEFMIVGLKLEDGSSIENNVKIRVVRGDKSAGKGEVKSLKLGVEEVKKVEGPNECGIKFVGNTLLEIGDVLELYKIEYK